MKIAIVASSFNKKITINLIKGAQKALSEKGVKKTKVFQTPGAYELPLACIWLSKEFDALVAVGNVIKGETPHFEYVSSVASKGIEKVSRDENVPIGFGVITANNRDQALARSSDDDKNLGYRAAMAAVAMLELKKEIEACEW